MPEPAWQSDDGRATLFLGDCLDVLAEIEAGSVQFVYADPPYNIGKAAWDKIEGYEAWCEQWIAACDRVLAANGAFWISHSLPDVLVDLSRMVERHGRKRINWITWDKYNAAPPSALWAMNKSKINPASKRSWDQDAEYLVYHADDGQWDRACGKLWSGEFEARRGFIFEPLRAYLDGERKRAGVGKAACNEACGFSRSAGGMASRHYFSRSQWCLPTREHYESLRRLFNAEGNGAGDYLRREYDYLRREYDDLRREYDYLRREYDDLRREYDHLRYTFHNPGKVSSVWQIPPAAPNGHPTPKPVELLRRMILATTNAGDTCLAPFAGSFPTGRVAIEEGRVAIGIEADRRSIALAAACCRRALDDLGLFADPLTPPRRRHTIEAARAPEEGGR